MENKGRLRGNLEARPHHLNSMDNTSNSTEAALLANRRAIAEEMFENVRWETDFKGACQCPGASDHTTPGADAVVFIDGCPTIHCLHASCRDRVEEANDKFRLAVRQAEYGTGHKFAPRPTENPRRQAREDLVHLEAQVRDYLPTILKEFCTPVRAWYESSPVKPDAETDNQWRQLLQLFDPEHIIWIGDTWDSGERIHRHNFRPVKAWLAGSRDAWGPFTCPVHFKPGTHSRAAKFVEAREFVVIESDVLSLRESSTVFRWLQQRLGLAAIVYTGGKSLHGWFKWPPGGLDLDEFKVILTGLKCDTKMLGASQPCRLPGFVREETGRWQQLLYLDLSMAATASAAPTPTAPVSSPNQEITN